MFGRYLKSQIMVLLCGGLVGPIFLVVYFALGQMSIMKWMFWVGLLITAADVLIALALANFGAKSDAKTQMLEASGVLGAGADHRYRRDGHPDQRSAAGEDQLARRGAGPHAVRHAGLGDRLGDTAADDHRPQSSSCSSIRPPTSTRSIGTEALW